MEVDLDLTEVRVLPAEEYRAVHAAHAERALGESPSYWEGQYLLDSMLRREERVTLEEYISLNSDWHPAGFYDPATRQVYFIQGDHDYRLWTEAIAHEFAHAWQHQRFGLAANPFRLVGTTEQQNIRKLLVEGEAQLVAAAQSCWRGGEPLSSMAGQDLRAAPLEVAAGRRLARYYNDGLAHAFACYQEGGWPAVTELLRTPPASTEQILHPEKRGQDLPTALALPEWPEEAGQAELVLQDVIGELGIYSLLVKHTSPFSSGQLSAAAGWDGDIVDVYRFSDGSPALRWRTLWDREEDAVEFMEAADFRSDGSLARSGRVVDLVIGGWREDDASEANRAVSILARQLKETMKSPLRVEDDEESAQLVARRLDREAEAAPHEAVGRWVFPRLAFSLPIPEGWNLNGTPWHKVLVTQQSGEDFSVSAEELMEFGFEPGEALDIEELERSGLLDSMPEADHAAIIVQDWPAYGRDLDSHLDDWRDLLDSNQTMRHRSWRSWEVGGVKGTRFFQELANEIPETHSHGIEWWFIRQGRVVRVSASFNPGAWDRLRRAAEEVVEGITWTAG